VFRRNGLQCCGKPDQQCRHQNQEKGETGNDQEIAATAEIVKRSTRQILVRQNAGLGEDITERPQYQQMAIADPLGSAYNRAPVCVITA
jgi:hypothetical protein